MSVRHAAYRTPRGFTLDPARGFARCSPGAASCFHVAQNIIRSSTVNERCARDLWLTIFFPIRGFRATVSAYLLPVRTKHARLSRTFLFFPPPPLLTVQPWQLWHFDYLREISGRVQPQPCDLIYTRKRHGHRSISRYLNVSMYLCWFVNEQCCTVAVKFDTEISFSFFRKQFGVNEERWQ